MASLDVSPGNESDLVVPLWINGEEKKGDKIFEVINPRTSTVCWSASSASIDDTLSAVSSAEEAFTKWSKTKPAHRAEILLDTARIMEQNIAEYASYMMDEMGADVGTAQFFVLPLAIQMLKDIAGRALTLAGSSPICQQDGQSCIVYKIPYGVTLGIVPWNAPFVFGIRSAATAIATGNTTILKASDVTPRCYWAIGQAFHQAGLPKGVLNIITCPPSEAAEVVNTMIEHPAVKKINFTGSAAVGRKIARACGQNLKPCLMELGGKNSSIVLDDADIPKAVGACVAGAFLNAGQICMATDQIIVHEAIAEEFQSALRQHLAKAADQNSPLPHVVSSSSKSRLTKLISDATSAGASIACGSDQTSLQGTSFIPTILDGANSTMEIANEENFGPLATITTVATDEEAIRLANSTGYGLSAAIFTKDLRRGLSVAKGIDTGAVHINSMTIHDEPSLPFGGVKNSGWGRFNAQEGLDEFLVTKCVTWDD